MDEELPSMEQYCQYLSYALIALTRRLGGAVVITQEEILEAMASSANFARVHHEGLGIALDVPGVEE